MGKRYEQLSLEERIELYRLLKEGQSYAAIGRALGRNRSTIGREIRRNSKATKQWAGGYKPVRAEQLAHRRRRWDARFKLARQPDLQNKVLSLLAMGWSPEQIAGRLALENNGTTVISHESIYRFIYHRSDQKDYLHRLLPRAKFRRGHYNRRAKSPKNLVKKRVSVAHRDPTVATRTSVGHWETDLMLFSNKKDNILVTQERMSRFVFMAKQEDKTAQRVVDQNKRWFERLPKPLRKTLTQDNGTEFFYHDQLHDIGVKTYFCDTHCPWQKGGVENHNGRLRRYLPRKTNPRSFNQDDIDKLAAMLNNTPRKCLGYQTPVEVLSEQLNLLHFKRESTSPPSRG